MPPGCEALAGKVVPLDRSLYGLEHAPMSWNRQGLADPCGFGLIDAGSVSIVAVVHVDDVFAVGRKDRRGRLCEDLNRLNPINNLGELRWYGGYRYPPDKVAGSLTISQKSRKTVKQFGVTTEDFLEVYGEEEPVGDWPHRELVW